MVEIDRIGTAERSDQGTHLVGVADIECRMIFQGLHPLQSPRQHGSRLDLKPQVDGEWLVLPALMEHRQRILRQWRGRRHGRIDQSDQRRVAIRHVVRRHGLLMHPVQQRFVVEQRQIAQGSVLQAAPRDLLGIRAVIFDQCVLFVARQQILAQRHGQRDAHVEAHIMNGRNMDEVHFLTQVRFTRQRQHQRNHGLVEGFVRQQRAERLPQSFVQYQMMTIRARGDDRLENIERQAVAGLPAVEAIAVVGHLKCQIVPAVGELPFHRRGKIAEQGRQRLLRNLGEHHLLARLGDFQHRFSGAGNAVAVQRQIAVPAQQPHAHGNQVGLFVRALRCCPAALHERQRVGLGGLVIHPLDIHLRGARLAVPVHELTEIPAADFRHGGDELLDRHRLTVMAREIQIRALAEQFRPQQGMHHAHHLTALLVDRECVEIGNFHVRRRLHRVRHGAAVFGKLECAQHIHVLHTLDHGRAHVSGKAGIAKHGKAFLETQLKPVAAGHAIAGPVVEVLMGDDGLNVLERLVGSDLGLGQHRGAVEDVEPLVLHGTHVEVVHRHDHEGVEIVFAAVDLLVPAHGSLQRIHGECTFVQILLFHEDAQRDLTATAGGETVFDLRQVSRHHGEQITRFGKGIVPHRPMAAVTALAAGHQIAVGQQDRIGSLVGTDGGGELGHHVGAIEIEGDLAKALGLALRAIHGAALVKPFKRSIILWLYNDFRVKPKVFIEFTFDAQGSAGVLVFMRGKQFSIDCQTVDFQIDTLQLQVGIGIGGQWIAAHQQFRPNPRFLVTEVDVELGFVDQKIRHLIFVQVDRSGLAVTIGHNELRFEGG